MTARSFSARLATLSQSVGSLLCLGLDPTGCEDGAGVERFCAALLEAALPHVVAVKPNLAFFEQHGSGGIAAMERIRESIGDSRLVVLDAKRGDIGNTAEAYARALFERWGADAVTVNPLMGKDAVAPFLRRPGTAALLLARTSNPGAGDFLEQRLMDGRPLFVHVVETARDWSGDGEVGFVVGATASAAVGMVRELAPTAPLLLPGVGAQGGDLEAAVAAGVGSDGAGLLVSVSRGISGAADPGAAAAALQRRIQSVRVAAARR